jgi:hypothetical protein
MNNNEIIELPNNSLLENDSSLIRQTYQCRICLEDEEDLDTLISPCRCNGTSKYVHKTCLRRWRYQDINSTGFHRCMECNEEYIILNNVELEDEDLFHIFDNVYYIFNFQLFVSFSLSLFTLLIDSIVNDYSLVKIFPNSYNSSVLDAVKEDYVYENIFYLNFGTYLQNVLFMLIYILRCCLFVKNKQELFFLMRNFIFNTLIYYNIYWIFMYGMLFNQLVGTCLLFVLCFQTFSFKINQLFIERHKICAMEINATLDTSVASMENNPLNIIVDGEIDESGEESEATEYENDESQLLD